MTGKIVQFRAISSYEPEVAFQLPAQVQLKPEALRCFQEGLEQLQQAEPEQAVERLSRAVELAPQCAEARICLGLAFALSHDIYPAIDQLETAGELDPESFAAHFSLAQLNFKLRVPRKGYQAADKALKCITTTEQRRMLAQLLKEERARERNGIARPWFNKPFSRTGVYLAGGGLAAALLAILIHIH